MPRGPKRYIMSAHDDTGNMFQNALGMTLNAWSKHKRRIDPVFKSDMQRRSFKRETILARRAVRAAIAAVPHVGPGPDPRRRMLRAINKLNRMSQPGWALRDFGGDNRTRPKIYVQGHGAPGLLQTVDNVGGVKTVRQTSTTLKRMKLPSRSKVRANSCFSGTQNAITAPVAIFNFLGGNPTQAPLSGPPGATYGGALAHDMRNVGRTFPQLDVGGYTSSTSIFPVPTVRSDMVTPTHSMATFYNNPGGGQLAVKRGDTKRYF